MTRPRRLTAATASLALGLALTACGDDGEAAADASASASPSASPSASESPSAEPSEEPSEEPSAAPDSTEAREAVLAAVAATEEKGTAAVRLSILAEAGGQEQEITGEGVIGLSGDPASSRVTLVVPMAGELETLSVDGRAFTRLPSDAETGVPPELAGKYLELPASEVGAVDTSGFGQALQQVRQASSVTEEGAGEVDGTATTDYEVTLTAADLEAAGSPPPPGIDEVAYTVAVGADGLIRQLAYQVVVQDPTAGAVSTTVDLTFTELGVPLDVAVPAPEEIVTPDELGGPPPA